MKSAITILSLLLISFPSWLVDLSKKKITVFSSLSYYGCDFDGDGRGDLAAWDTKTNTLYYQLSSTEKFYQKKFFEKSKVSYDPVFADYDGDGRTDFSFFSERTGHWVTYKTTDPATPDKTFFGAIGDLPIPGNFNGDESFERGVFRANAALWLIKKPNAGGKLQPSLVRQGNYQDNPITADYDGDGKSDLTTWRLDDGNWYIVKSADGYSSVLATTIQHGKQEDIIVPNDYNGDGRYDLALWRPENKTWYIKYNEYKAKNPEEENAEANDEKSGFIQKIQFGEEGDIPLSLDMNNDGIPELVMWNPKLKSWNILSIKDRTTSSLKWNIPEGCLPASTVIHRF